MCQECFDVKVSRAVEARLVDELNTINTLRQENRQLKQANDEARRQQALLQPQMNCLVCLFQKMIPPEIRNNIYKLLLVNPQLGESYWIDKSVKFGAEFKYGLSPALLQTCTWMYQEAAPILYGTANTFIIMMCPEKMSIPRSPLTRYLDHGQLKFDFKEVMAFAKIRNWRVITSVDKNMGSSSLLAQFCRKISKKPIAFLDLVVMLAKGPHDQDGLDRQAVSEIIKTASGLRAIGDLIIRPAKSKDFHVLMIKDWKPHFPKGPFIHPEVAQWCRLVRGTSPVENLYDMRTRLVTYAQYFERNEALRAYMDPQSSSLDMYNEAEEYSSKQRNVFLLDPDSTEIVLGRATQAVHTQDSKLFKNYRQAVLLGLEPQYQRIREAFNSVRALIQQILKEHFYIEQILEDYLGVTEWFEEAYQVVETAASSFHRKLTTRASSLIRQEPIYQPCHHHLPRERAIAEMNRLLSSFNMSDEDGVEYLGDFLDLFKFVVKDMEKQYNKIRTSRKALLADDPPNSKPDCGIDLKVEDEDEDVIIQWERECDTDSDMDE